MSKPIFTVTEVKDWINDLIAENSQIITGILTRAKAKTKAKKFVEQFRHNIEMLEYIRDNHLPIIERREERIKAFEGFTWEENE